MKELRSYHLQKCSDVRVDKVRFEVCDNGGNVIFDMERDVDGGLRVLFHQACAGIVVRQDVLMNILSEVSGRLAREG